MFVTPSCPHVDNYSHDAHDRLPYCTSQYIVLDYHMYLSRGAAGSVISIAHTTCLMHLFMHMQALAGSEAALISQTWI